MTNGKSNAAILTHRLSQEVFSELEKAVYAVLPTIPKTELEAGFSLGAQHVIRVIRDGITISS